MKIKIQKDQATTLNEAIPLRHAVRQYQPMALTSQQVEQLQAKISELNTACNLHMQLIVNDEDAFNSRMAHYGNFKNVKNLVAVVGNKKDLPLAANPTISSLDERAGYAVAEFVLYAQTLGLNTCVAGMTFKKTENFKIDAGESLVVAIAIGVGETQGVQHPMKPATRIAPDYESSPDWFKKGIDTVLFAPSALNQFKATFSLNDDGTVSAKARLGFSAKVDLGIFKHYFELAVGKENFSWK